jgi:hypothetical protein
VTCIREGGRVVAAYAPEATSVVANRPEAGSPQQPLGLGGAEGTAIDRDRRHDRF